MAKSESLRTYNAKRDFTKTAEPAGRLKKTKAKALRFVVQKHDATRLHYDFRLELDGVLLSWAVTRGPSTNPADKRLAVHVEDHPLDYGGFEGTIPAGQYGGGTVMLWDEGTWEPIGDPHDGLARGDLKFVLHGRRMQGEWVLVHMKGRDATKRDGTTRENWLLIKHHDEYATSTDGLTEKFTTSVETGRDLAGIANGSKPPRKAALVGEAGFTELAPDSHPRHPSFLGLGEDKKGTEVELEQPVDTPAKARSKTAKKFAAVALTDEIGIAAAKAAGVALTHPDRAEYPDGPTKAQLVAYYAAVADHMLPHIARRPLSLVRSPHGGIAHTFFQKHDSGGFPVAIKKIPIPETTAKIEDYLYVDGLAGLIAGVQMNTLEFHIWGSHIDQLEKPDRIIFDIDPDEGLGFPEVRRAAADIRAELGKWGLDSYPMVTGGKGIHVIAPLRPVTEWPDVKLFCKTFADKLAENEPDRFTSNIRKAARKGRMFVDYLRNERGATAIAPFSTRARAGAPCAVPIAWAELETLDHANGFTLATAAARAAAPDPWPDYFALTQSITKAMVSAVAGDKMQK